MVPKSPLTEVDMQSALFVGADPADCHGAVAFGRYPIFPTNYTGREARTQQDGQPNSTSCWRCQRPIRATSTPQIFSTPFEKQFRAASIPSSPGATTGAE